MLVYPDENIPTAWGLCRSDDFEEPRCRVTYDALTHAWAVKGHTDWSLPALEMEVVALTAALRFRCDMREAWGVIGYILETPPCEHPDHIGRRADCFRWHCEALATEGAVRRTRDVLGRWYMALTTLYIRGGDLDGVPLPDFMPYDSMPATNIAMRICETMTRTGTSVQGRIISAPNPRGILAGLLRDIRATLRRTPHAPQQAGAVPEVGEW